MKTIFKNFFPVFLIIILCLSYVFSQDEKSEDLPEENTTKEVKKEKSDAPEKEPVEKEADSNDQPEENIEADEENEAEPVNKSKIVKKTIINKEPEKRRNLNEKGKASLLEIDNGLLRITPGETLLKRIPEIKLSNKKPMDVEDIVRIPDSLGDTKESLENISEADGFFGFNKKTSEIIAQISIVLLILLVFVLYKARSGGSSRRV